MVKLVLYEETSFLSSRASVPSSSFLGPLGSLFKVQVLGSDLWSGLGPCRPPPPLKQDPTCVTCPAIFAVIVCEYTLYSAFTALSFVKTLFAHTDLQV